MQSPMNPPERQTKWKRRLNSLQSSFRSSFRSKRQHSSKDIKEGDQAGNSGTKIEWKKATNASSADPGNEDMYYNSSWRENRAERKHTNLSKLNKKQDNYKPMSTRKVHSMHGKTFADGRRTDKWRNHYSNNNLCDIGKDNFRDRMINSHFDLTSTEITSKEYHDSAKVKSTLSRPKSLNILSSLFNRSSRHRTNSKPKRGKFRAEPSQTTAKQFVEQRTSSNGKINCDPSIDSEDEFLDTDGSYLNLKRYYSLKRSRASLIFPPTSDQDRKPVKLREKSRTFCGVQEPVKFDEPNSDTVAVRDHGRVAKTRKSATRKRRAVPLLVPIPSSSLELLQPEAITNKSEQPLIGTNYTHLRYKGVAISNIRCITRTVSMSTFSNIPSLGVTYVDNDGVEKTLVILNGNATQSCYDLLRHKERLSIPLKFHRGLEKSRELVNMGNSSGRLERSASYGDILDQRGSLGPSSSTPDLFLRRTSYTLTQEHNVKKTKKMTSMLKGLSLKRHTLTVNSKNPGKKDKSRKLFGLDGRHGKTREEYNSHLGHRLAGCNSLSRSVDCLTDLQRKKIPPVQVDSDLFSHKLDSQNHMNEYETIQPKNKTTINPVLDNFLSESDGDDSSVTSNDSWIDSPNVKTIIIRRGSQPSAKSNSTTKEEELFIPNSLPADNSARQWRGPLYHSTPIARMSTLERERSKSAVSDDPEVPPPVRPRIQSLEELSPVTAEVILRKKKSLASRKIRLIHSTSVPGEEYVTENDSAKRYSLGTEMGDLLDGPVPLTAFKSFSTDYLDSEESLNDDGSSSSLSEKHLTPPYFSPLKVSMEDISKSPTIHEEVERVDAEESRKSLSRNPRLGRSTGDLSFEPGGTLKRKSGEMNPGQVEDMDVPEAFAEALWDHVTMDPEELSFKAGDIITVISMTNIDWWFGQVGESVGWFPAPFVRVRVSQTLDELENHLAPPIRTRRFTNEGMLTRDVVRARVVNEILETEKAYVKNLKDVVEGYLRQAQKRNEMFSEEEIDLLFSNIEELYTFHQKLLAQMKKCYVKEDPCASQIGAVFLENKLGFNSYSEYCNNHPQAIAQFKILNENAKYKHFFEACRLLQEMINISLDGFLLTPVQKICKYPLQLAELLKHTHKTHKDYEPVRQALESMKNVAALINERKRKVENISKIAKWQSTIENWEGENVLERSSELIHSGEVYKVFNGTTQERVCFLFDHQLIYCKKDILRKNGLTYKGRIDMDLAQVEWLEDGEETYKNEPLHNAWRIYNAADSKWYLVFTKKPEHKEKWIAAFEKEKMKANEEAQSGLSISQSTRRAVMRSASSSIKGRKAAEKREKFLARTSSQNDFLKSPPSPILRLPPAVSSKDFNKEEDAAVKESVLGFLQRTSALRRSFGLRGSKRNHKDKRTSSVF